MVFYIIQTAGMRKPLGWWTCDESKQQQQNKLWSWWPVTFNSQLQIEQKPCNCIPLACWLAEAFFMALHTPHTPGSFLSVTSWSTWSNDILLTIKYIYIERESSHTCCAQQRLGERGCEYKMLQKSFQRMSQDASLKKTWRKAEGHQRVAHNILS